MKISVCIPAYNRPETLRELLVSIGGEAPGPFEVVISDDHSPREADMRGVVDDFRAAHPDVPLLFWRNEETLGYDGNLRRLVERARGDYCMYMGDDDLVHPGALGRLAAALERHPNTGVMLRSYVTFDGSPDNIVQEYRYFPADRYFSAGPDTVATFYRRSVVIPGMVVHRETAAKYATDRWDGTLLYQLHLVGNILLDRDGLYLSSFMTKYRLGGVHSFGVSRRERGRYVPKVIPPEHSLVFMKGMFEIARALEADRRVPVYRRIVADIGNYSYPVLSIQAHSLRGYVWYSWQLARLGLWRNKFFYVYFVMILVLRPRRVERLIRFVKRRLGYTPLFGRIYAGEPVDAAMRAGRS